MPAARSQFLSVADYRLVAAAWGWDLVGSNDGNRREPSERRHRADQPVQRSAPAVYHYVLVTTTITSTTDASKGIPPLFAEWNVQLVDAATGATFEPSTTVVPTELPTNDIFSGQSATGDVAFVIPDTVGALL